MSQNLFVSYFILGVVSGACIQTQISKIIKLVHNLLTKLMSMFPMERTATNASSKYDELDGLYLNVGKVISEGLSKFEKMDNPSNFFSTVMILKAACINNHSYIDLLITPFMASLQRLAKEHLQPSTNESGARNNLIFVLTTYLKY